MSTNDLDKLFRDGLQNMEKTPGERVWGRVLSNLNAGPNPSESKQFLKLIYGGIAFLLVAIPLSYWFLNPKPTDRNLAIQSGNPTYQKPVETELSSAKTSETNSTVSPSVQEKSIDLDNKFNSNNSARSEKNNKLSTSANPPKIKQKQTTSNSAKAKNKPQKSPSGINPVNNQNPKPSRFKFQSIPNRSPLIGTSNPESTTLPSSSQLPYGLVSVPDAMEYYTLPFRQVEKLEPKTNNAIETRTEKKEIPQNYYKLKGLHFGIIGAINTVWILNQNTYGQFGKYEMAYKVKLGYYYGAELGYDLTNHFGIQAEYHYRSAQGQDYADKIKRKNISRSVDLVYQNIPLIFKFKSPRISGEFDRPSSVNLLLGVQYSMLYYAKQKLNNQELVISERFRKNDIGVLFGLEYNAFLSNRIFVSTGIRATFGLLDMNSKEWENTGTNGSKSSHNATVGFNLGLHYKLF